MSGGRDGLVLAGSRDDKLSAFTAKTGALAWSRTFGVGSGYGTGSPSVANGVVYAASYEGTIDAFAASSGKQLWAYSTGSIASFMNPAISDGTLYATSFAGYAHAFALDSGTSLRRFRRQAPATVSLHPDTSLRVGQSARAHRDQTLPHAQAGVPRGMAPRERVGLGGLWPFSPRRCYRPAPMQAPLISVVVPVRNEAPNIEPLIAEIRAALAGVAHEIVYVDDGSDDDTLAVLREAALAGGLTVVRHLAGCGQSAAIVTGVRAARGHWIATLDGDGQNDPADIPALLARAEAETSAGAELLLIAGHRTRRQDGYIKRITSRVANGIRAALLGDATPDTGCGLKMFTRAAFLELPAFDHMHRFLPALFIRAGGKVFSVPVNHRPRLRGASKYGTLDRLWVGIFDLAGVYWLQRRWKRPVIES